MQIAKSGNKSGNAFKGMLWVAVGVFIIAIATIFFQNFEKTPAQTEVHKEIKIK